MSLRLELSSLPPEWSGPVALSEWKSAMLNALENYVYDSRNLRCGADCA